MNNSSLNGYWSVVYCLFRSKEFFLHKSGYSKFGKINYWLLSYKKLPEQKDTALTSADGNQTHKISHTSMK